MNQIVELSSSDVLLTLFSISYYQIIAIISMHGFIFFVELSSSNVLLTRFSILYQQIIAIISMVFVFKCYILYARSRYILQIIIIFLKKIPYVCFNQSMFCSKSKFGYYYYHFNLTYVITSNFLKPNLYLKLLIWSYYHYYYFFKKQLLDYTQGRLNYIIWGLRQMILIGSC